MNDEVFAETFAYFEALPPFRQLEEIGACFEDCAKLKGDYVEK